MTFATGGGLAAMHIDSSQRVGIGTASPGEKLHVVGAGVRIDRSNGDPYIDFYTSGAANNVALYGGAVTGFRAFVGGSERLRITSTGLVGIGTSTPAHYLHVSASVNDAVTNIVNTDTTNGYGLSVVAGGSASNRYIARFADAGNNAKAIILANGNVGIGTTSPITTQGGLDVSSGGISLVIGADSNAQTRTNSAIKAARLATPHYTNAEEPFGLLFGISDSSTNELYIGGGTTAVNAATDIRFHTAANNTTTSGSERARIDSIGRFLVGTSSAVGTYGFQIEQASGSPPFAGSILLRRGLTTAEINATGYTLGAISAGSQTDIGGSILFESDAAWGSGDYPTRLVFSTTADGASSPTERMRISNDGRVSINTTAKNYQVDIRSDGNLSALGLTQTSNSFAQNAFFIDVNRTTTDGSYNFLRCIQVGATDKLFIRDSGNVVNANNSYGAISDARLKENIVDATSQYPPPNRSCRSRSRTRLPWSRQRIP
jgi:hypothetical protein